MVEPATAFSFIGVHIAQFSVCLLLAGVIARLTDKRWPHLAFLICMLAFIKCLTPPVVTSPAGLFTRSHTLANATQLRLFSSDELIRRKNEVQEARPIFAQSVAGTVVLYPDQQFSPPTGFHRAPPVWGMTSAYFLLIGWAAGAAAVILRSRQNLSRLRKITDNCEETLAESRLGKLVALVSRDIGLGRKIRILVCPQNHGPMLYGIATPTLLLPSRLIADTTDADLKPIVAHELIHARRGDVLWGVLQYIVCVIWWFHPLVWWLGRRANAICERCCDQETIAGIRCSATEYAASLIRILELKLVLRAVPGPCGIRSSEITSRRLERIMKYCNRFCRRTSRIAWSLALVLAVVVLPGAVWVTAQDEPAVPQAEDVDLRGLVNNALAQRDWPRATSLLKVILQKYPDDPRATFLLGYALHSDGKLDEAIAYHEKASRFPQTMLIATYNWACALCLQGHHDQSIEKLTQAVDAGFRPQQDLKDDPDLNALHGTEAFEALRQRAQMTASADTYRQLDFWIGEWDAVDATGKLLGTNSITAQERGFVIREQWTGVSKGTGTSTNYFDPAEKKWKQLWVDASGAVAQYTGNFDNGKMEMIGQAIDRSGNISQSRMTLTPLPDGRVAHHVERSSDDGETWTTYFDGFYTPRGAAVQTGQNGMGNPTQTLQQTIEALQGSERGSVE